MAWETQSKTHLGDRSSPNSNKRTFMKFKHLQEKRPLEEEKSRNLKMNSLLKLGLTIPK
jgi:hypothetical protein